VVPSSLRDNRFIRRPVVASAVSSSTPGSVTPTSTGFPTISRIRCDLAVGARTAKGPQP
jgi:hypothetical protein